MARFLINFLFFLLPFATYWIFILISRKAEDRPDLKWSEAPFGWLIVAGLALGVGSMLVAGIYTANTAGTDYEPARLIDGEIQSGTVE
ncbi:MAG: hypothetical protein HEP70_11865 [Rhodobiaceae bacterium]|nr:hypothetical protein [Rhodobiaceae bacterium]